MNQVVKKIAWKDSYRLGHEQVDMQHKEIFEIVYILNNACVDGSGKAKLQETLRFLETYTIQHFYYEEELQLRYSFPEYDNHKKMHGAFAKTVDEVKSIFSENGSSVELSRRLNESLLSWLIHHIQREDTKIGKHIAESNASYERNSLLIVDDDKSSLLVLNDILRSDYTIFTARNGLEGIERANEYNPDLILLDVLMPEMSGYEVLSVLKDAENTKDIPVILLTGIDDTDSERMGFDLGAADYVKKPFSAPLLLKRIKNQLLIVRKTRDLVESRAEILTYAGNLEKKMCEKAEEVFDLQNAVMNTVADLVEFRDGSTGGHIIRTRLYLKALVERLMHDQVYAEELSGWNMYFFLQSAQLHDVGKIAISDLILNKPDKLTEEEFEIMKTHVNAGENAIERIMSETHKNAFLEHALLIASTHHEKWDGTGYPLGIKGKNIPLEGRLMAIADVYDALTTSRPYKEAFTHEQACKIIEEGAGKHFDPVLVDVFFRIENEFAQISRKIGG